MRTKKESWIDLLIQYTSERDTLKALFHLVDSRHGILDADTQCFSILKSLPEHVKYIVVLTKFDKLLSDDLRRTASVVDKIKQETLKYTERNVPILFTSSESRIGGATVWSAVLDAIAGQDPIDFSQSRNHNTII